MNKKIVRLLLVVAGVVLIGLLAYNFGPRVFNAILVMHGMR